MNDTESMNYGKEIFTVVSDDNCRGIILGFCEALSQYNLSEAGIENTEVLQDYMMDLMSILERLPKPYTIIQEFHHIDRSFRDTYYTYFSNQHFQVKRYSRRLSFIKGRVTSEDFFSECEDTQQDIAKRFMGSMVINPLSKGVIGRTLIAPEYLLEDYQRPVYVRLSEFTVHVYGKKFSVRAFPYRMQDEETMSCAEVTLLNLLEYYSNSYHDYRSVVPSEILESEQRHNHERVLPSRGITYPILTKVLSEFGFAPRLYNLSSIDKYSLSQVTQKDELKRWLHYYIKSGIPVALNLLPAGNVGAGHSIVCMGHGRRKKELTKKAKRNKWIFWEDKDSSHPIINSADFYDEYVVIDDNQPVYQVRNFEQLSLYPDMRVENMAVPLYKRMFLDASDAAVIIRSLLHHEQFGIDVWAKGVLKEKEDVIIRIFMASSHSLKDFRSKTLEDIFAREAYALVPMPRFVWVCELYREEDYDDGLKAFGEIVIDATSSRGMGNGASSLIMMHYPNVLGVRYPEQPEAGFKEMLVLEKDGFFPGYRKNLSGIY